MELTLELVKRIVKEYERISDREAEKAMEFCCDDDNTGFSYDYMSFDDICKQIIINLNK